jgi:hypothetical protein
VTKPLSIAVMAFGVLLLLLAFIAARQTGTVLGATIGCILGVAVTAMLLKAARR